MANIVDVDTIAQSKCKICNLFPKTYLFIKNKVDTIAQSAAGSAEVMDGEAPMKNPSILFEKIRCYRL